MYILYRSIHGCLVYTKYTAHGSTDLLHSIRDVHWRVGSSQTKSNIIVENVNRMDVAARSTDSGSIYMPYFEHYAYIDLEDAPRPILCKIYVQHAAYVSTIYAHVTSLRDNHYL